MPVYHFVLHTYRSWNSDNPYGYHQRGEPRIKPSNPALAACRNRLAIYPPFNFSSQQQFFLINVSRETCIRRSWRLHAMLASATHLHILVSWKTSDDVAYVYGLLKRTMSREIGKLYAIKNGTPRFSRGVSRTRIRNSKHFAKARGEYFPKHIGWYWREGMANPVKCGAI